MKSLFLIITLFVSLTAYSQDLTQIIVDISNDPTVYYKGTADGAATTVKRRATVLQYSAINALSKEFSISLKIVYYKDNAGAYGAKITDLIAADAGLSTDQKATAAEQLKDRVINYETTGKYVNSSTGLSVPQFQGDGVTPTVGAISDLAYWGNFKLNQVPNMGATTAVQGAVDSQYKIINAIVTQMSTRKNF